MKSYKSEVLRAMEDFNGLLVDLLHESDLTQVHIAEMLGTTAPTVCRYLNPNEEYQLPAIAIPFLPPHIALPLLNFLGAAHGFRVCDDERCDGAKCDHEAKEGLQSQIDQMREDFKRLESLVGTLHD
jgi:hypothetical protein